MPQVSPSGFTKAERGIVLDLNTVMATAATVRHSPASCDVRRQHALMGNLGVAEKQPPPLQPPSWSFNKGRAQPQPLMATCITRNRPSYLRQSLRAEENKMALQDTKSQIDSIIAHTDCAAQEKGFAQAQLPAQTNVQGRGFSPRSGKPLAQLQSLPEVQATRKQPTESCISVSAPLQPTTGAEQNIFETAFLHASDQLYSKKPEHLQIPQVQLVKSQLQSNTQSQILAKVRARLQAQVRLQEQTHQPTQPPSKQKKSKQGQEPIFQKPVPRRQQTQTSSLHQISSQSQILAPPPTQPLTQSIPRPQASVQNNFPMHNLPQPQMLTTTYVAVDASAKYHLQAFQQAQTQLHSQTHSLNFGNVILQESEDGQFQMKTLSQEHVQAPGHLHRVAVPEATLELNTQPEEHNGSGSQTQCQLQASSEERERLSPNKSKSESSNSQQLGQQITNFASAIQTQGTPQAQTSSPTRSPLPVHSIPGSQQIGRFVLTTLCNSSSPNSSGSSSKPGNGPGTPRVIETKEAAPTGEILDRDVCIQRLPETTLFSVCQPTTTLKSNGSSELEGLVTSPSVSAKATTASALAGHECSDAATPFPDHSINETLKSSPINNNHCSQGQGAPGDQQVFGPWLKKMADRLVGLQGQQEAMATTYNESLAWLCSKLQNQEHGDGQGRALARPFEASSVSAQSTVPTSSTSLPVHSSSVVFPTAISEKQSVTCAPAHCCSAPKGMEEVHRRSTQADDANTFLMLLDKHRQALEGLCQLCQGQTQATALLLQRLQQLLNEEVGVGGELARTIVLLDIKNEALSKENEDLRRQLQIRERSLSGATNMVEPS